MRKSFIEILRNPTLTEKQASTLLDVILVAIQSKPIKSDKQRKQLLNLIQSFKNKRLVLLLFFSYKNLFSFF